jgi:hypothetical protein
MIYTLFVDYLCENPEEQNDFNAEIISNLIRMKYIDRIVKPTGVVYKTYMYMKNKWFKYDFYGMRFYYRITSEDVFKSKLRYLKEIMESPLFTHRGNIGDYGYLCVLNEKRPFNMPFYTETYSTDFEKKYKYYEIYSDGFLGPLNVYRIFRIYDLKSWTVIFFDNLDTHIVFLPKNLDQRYLKFIMVPFASKDWFTDDRMRGYYEKLNAAVEEFPENKSLRLFVEEFNKIYATRSLSFLGDKI